MVFSENKNREFLADIPLVISDSSGNSILELLSAGADAVCVPAAGPIQGQRQIHGVTQTQEVTLAGNDGKDLHFHWEGTPRSSIWTVARE